MYVCCISFEYIYTCVYKKYLMYVYTCVYIYVLCTLYILFEPAWWEGGPDVDHLRVFLMGGDDLGTPWADSIPLVQSSAHQVSQISICQPPSTPPPRVTGSLLAPPSQSCAARGGETSALHILYVKWLEQAGLRVVPIRPAMPPCRGRSAGQALHPSFFF